MGEWRLIIDVSHLNCFPRVPRFKMETTAIQPELGLSPWIFGTPIFTS
jgi:hypothetical protein